MKLDILLLYIGTITVNTATIICNTDFAMKIAKSPKNSEKEGFSSKNINYATCMHDYHV